ncbi:tetratricopeptide repeat protein [Parvularcula sp. IMCC14364]|uniref:tetratricopeptide repeat protein n=1 Tax=Parvularcula sp. IMCC14364 TaxID=3067902 RepID=UPI002741057F|nr:tetratricopeptide repeat protein [Parvularcula sp. IMCC14364]
MALDDGSQEIRDVDRQIKEDQQVEDLKRSLPWFIGVALVVVLIVAGRQFWEVRQTNMAEATAVEFNQAVTLIETDQAAALIAFDDIIDNGPDGYAAMAALRAGALAERMGDKDAALRYFLKIAENDAQPKRLRDLARVRAGYLALDQGRDRTMGVLNGLEAEETAFGMHAKEIAGLAALTLGDYQTALTYFETIQATADLAPRIAGRAEEFAALAHLGAEGKSLELVTQTQPDGLLDLMDDVLAAPAGQPTNENETQEDGTSGN